jgi:hypothetical protein
MTFILLMRNRKKYKEAWRKLWPILRQEGKNDCLRVDHMGSIGKNLWNWLWWQLCINLCRLIFKKCTLHKCAFFNMHSSFVRMLQIYMSLQKEWQTCGQHRKCQRLINMPLYEFWFSLFSLSKH